MARRFLYLLQLPPVALRTATMSSLFVEPDTSRIPVLLLLLLLSGVPVATNWDA